MKQRRPTPQLATKTSTPQTAAPAVAPASTNGMDMMGFDIPSVLSDVCAGAASLTGASDWVDAVRRLGPSGSVVLDALPLEVSLPRIHELWDQPFIREYVLDLDPRVVSRLAPSISLDLLEEAWPVGVGLGFEGDVLFSGRSDGLTGKGAFESHCEAFRLGPDSTQLVGGCEAIVGARTGLGDADDPNQAGASFRRFVQLDYTATVATDPFELAVGAWNTLRGEAPGAVDIVGEQAFQQLSGLQPEVRIGQSVSVSASFLDTDQFDDAVPDFIDFPRLLLDCALGSVLSDMEGTVAGELIFPASGCIQVLHRVDADYDFQHQPGATAILPMMGALHDSIGAILNQEGAFSAEFLVDTGAESIEQLMNGVLEPESLAPSLVHARLSRTNEGTCDTLEFTSLSALEAFVRASVPKPVGDNPTDASVYSGIEIWEDRMSDALRNSGIEVYRRTVRRSLPASSPLIPDGVVGLCVEDDDLELVLEASVDARALALAFERAPTDVVMARFPNCGPMDAIDAVLGLLKGDRPPAWFTLDTTLVRSAVDVASARVQGVIELESSHTTVLNDDKFDPEKHFSEDEIKKALADGGPAAVEKEVLKQLALATIDMHTEAHREITGTATIRVDQEVAVGTRTLWESMAASGGI